MVKKMAADKSSTPLQLTMLLIALVCCISGVTTSAASGTSSSSSNKTCEYPGYPDPNNASVCIPFTQVCTRISCPTAMASVNKPGQRGLPRYILSDANNASLFSFTGIILHSGMYNLSNGLHKDTFQGYPKLYTIEMVNSGISDIPLGLFFNLTQLAILTLTDNKLSTLPAGIFDTVPQLVRLTLAGNKLSTLPAGIFDTMPRLQYLFLDRNALVSVPNGLLSYNPSIVQLILGGNKELKTLPGDLFATNGYSRNIIIEVIGNPFITLPVDKWPSNTILLGFTNTEVVYLPIRKKGIVINGGSWCVPEGKFNCSAYKTEGCFYGCCAAGECPACSVGDAVYTPNGGITVHSATNITYYCDAGYRLQSASDRATCSSGKYIHPGCAVGCSCSANYVCVNSTLGTCECLWPFIEKNGACTPYTEECQSNACPIATGSPRLFQHGLPLYYNNGKLNTDIGQIYITRGSVYNNLSSSLHKDTFRNYTLITKITMKHAQLTAIPAGLFDSQIGLTTLDLSVNLLISLPAGLLSNNHQLTHLWLSNNRIGSLPAGLLRNNSKLMHVFLGQNNLVTLPADFFSPSQNGMLFHLGTTGQNKIAYLPVDKWPAAVMTQTPFDHVVRMPVVFPALRIRRLDVVSGPANCPKFNCSYLTSACVNLCCKTECPPCDFGVYNVTSSGGIVVHSSTNVSSYCNDGYRLKGASNGVPQQQCSGAPGYTFPGCEAAV
eukprot:scpid53182/ scgid6069/ Peroxidasin